VAVRLSEGLMILCPNCWSFVDFQESVPEQLEKMISSSPESTVFFIPFKNPPSSIDVSAM